MKTKKQKLAEAHTTYEAAKAGTRPIREPKSIPTHPVVPCPDLPEREVLVECMRWLRQRRILHNRHDCGSRSTGYGFVMFGIKHSGDIHGYLPDGRGFEIECKKSKGGRLSKGQQDRMRDVRATNGVYVVIHGIPELE